VTGARAARRRVSRGALLGDTGYPRVRPSAEKSFFFIDGNQLCPVPARTASVPVEVLTFPVASAPSRSSGRDPSSRRPRSNTTWRRDHPASRLWSRDHRFLSPRDRDRIVLSGNFNLPAIAALLAPFWRHQRAVFSPTRCNPHQGGGRWANYRSRSSAPGDCSYGALQPTHARGRRHRLRAAATRRLCRGAVSNRHRKSAASSVSQPGVDSLRFGGEWRRRHLASASTRRSMPILQPVTLVPADESGVPAEVADDLACLTELPATSLAVWRAYLFDVFPTAIQHSLFSTAFKPIRVVTVRDERPGDLRAGSAAPSR